MIAKREEAGVPVLVIESALCRAKLSLYGAQLLSWVPAGGEEVFYVSSQMRYQEGKALRGGVPICWPWFGKAGSPAHGWARLSLWCLEKAEELESGEVRLCLSFTPREGEGLRAEYELVLGLEAKFFLKTYAGRQDHLLSQAFHSYFAVSDARKVIVEGLDSEDFEEFGAGVTRKEGSGFVCVSSVDRVYPYCLGKAVLWDNGKGRKIEIERWRCPSWVLWSPDAALVEGMNDVPNEEAYHFLCLEAGNVGQGSILLKSKSSKNLGEREYVEVGMRICVRRER